MRIEITDIPQGKIIKHINVDITFEDGIPESKVTFPAFESDQMIEDTVKVQEQIKQDSKQDKSNIPDEMINGSF